MPAFPRECGAAGKKAPPHPQHSQGDTSDHQGHRSHQSGEGPPANSRDAQKRKGSKWLGCSSKRILPAPSPGLWMVIPAPRYGPPTTTRESRGLLRPPLNVGGGIEPTHTDPEGAAGRPPSDQHQLPASQLQVCLQAGPKDTVPEAPTPVARPHFLPHSCVQAMTVLSHAAATGHVLLFK